MWNISAFYPSRHYSLPDSLKWHWSCTLLSCGTVSFSNMPCYMSFHFIPFRSMKPTWSHWTWCRYFAQEGMSKVGIWSWSWMAYSYVLLQAWPCICHKTTLTTLISWPASITATSMWWSVTNANTKLQGTKLKKKIIKQGPNIKGTQKGQNGMGICYKMYTVRFFWKHEQLHYLFQFTTSMHHRSILKPSTFTSTTETPHS